MEQGMWLSPLEIETLFQCFYLADPLHDMRRTPLTEEILTKWEQLGLIHKATCTVLPRGVAMVRLLCSTPLPEQVWIDPRTSQLIEGDKE